VAQLYAGPTFPFVIVKKKRGLEGRKVKKGGILVEKRWQARCALTDSKG
jgi:hypothetical protein